MFFLSCFWHFTQTSFMISVASSNNRWVLLYQQVIILFYLATPCSMWDLPQPGIKPVPPALGAQSQPMDHTEVPASNFWINYSFNFSHLIIPKLYKSRVGAGREGDDRGWDGWMASPTWWTWVWVDSGSWWWTGRPGVLRFMGSQRVGHDWATELNWTERQWYKVPPRSCHPALIVIHSWPVLFYLYPHLFPTCCITVKFSCY